MRRSTDEERAKARERRVLAAAQRAVAEDLVKLALESIEKYGPREESSRLLAAAEHALEVTEQAERWAKELEEDLLR